MKKIALWIGGTLIVALGTIEIAKAQFPSFVMKKALKTLEEGYEIGTNEMAHAAPITAQNQRVVRPSPDLAYSICLYDVSVGYVVINIPKAENYLSAALYDTQTNNFYHINDSEMNEGGIRLVLYKEASPDTLPSSSLSKYVSTPSETGLVLIRRVISDERDWVIIEKERAKMSCRPV